MTAGKKHEKDGVRQQAAGRWGGWTLENRGIDSTFHENGK